MSAAAASRAGSSPGGSMPGARAAPLLEVRGLSVHFAARGGLVPWRRRHVRAVDGVDLTIGRQETLGVVGESGCGKTTLGRAILRLLRPTAGQVLLEGQDILRLGGRELRAIRRHMQIVFQNPYSSFDPRFTVLNAVAEPLRTHTSLRGQALVRRVVEVLEQCGMSGDMLYRYPHEFSGGQLQRIAIARALAL
ncbi:MAG: dipeptide/oligopeptide/nickel ABC transporter ATP-binding protein, partial [Anaerolineae bacterium]|nr:dipeptide/oligopeptide/nickel ABC transporter ATP-binding protein [Anaerolineae bacterium]